MKLSATNLVRIWQNHTGAGILKNGRFVRWGLIGSADILGIMCGGKFLAIEVKTGKAKQSEQQKKFEAMINAMGGVYFVANSAEDAMEKLKLTLAAS